MNDEKIKALEEENQKLKELLVEYAGWLEALTAPDPEDSEYCEHCGNRTSGKFHNDLDSACLMDASRVDKGEPNTVLGHWRKTIGIRLQQTKNLIKMLNESIDKEQGTDEKATEKEG